MFKKIIISFGVLLVLIVGGILIAPSFINWNAQFPRIAAQVKQATGRDLSIGGRLEVRLLPSPTLTARNVTLSNVPGAGAAPMVKLDAVEIRMALLPLLSGQVQVERIRLINPTIRIETLKDGRSNLSFSPEGEKSPSPRGVTAQSSPTSGSPEKQGSRLKLRFDNFKIVNATIIYHDARKNRTETISNLDAVLRSASVDGPFAVQGQGRVRGLPVTFDVSLGQIIAERTLPLNAVLTGPAGIRVQVSGAVLELENNPRFKGTVKMVGDNLAAGMNALIGTRGAPSPLEQPFSLNSTLDASAQAVKLSGIEFQLGTARVSGQAKVKIGKATTFDVALKAARIDVDRFLSAPRADASKSPFQKESVSRTSGTITPPPPKAGGGNTQKVFALPRDISGTVALNVDALTIKGGLISDLRMNAELVGGEFALNQFQFQAPGVSDIALFGFMRASGGRPQFDGNLEMLSSNPKGLADWLGVKMPPGVAQRLKRISYKSKIRIDPAQVALSVIELNGDRTKVTGGVSVALRSRPSFGADLSVDTLDLDTYASASLAAPAAAVQPLSGGAQALRTATPPQRSGGSGFDIATVWTALNALNAFDANLKLRFGRLTTGGRTFKNLAFDGTLYAGALTVRTLRLGTYQGASADLSGTFNGFGGIPEMSAVKIKAKVGNAARLGAALGLKLPRGVGAVNLNARAEGSFLQPRLSVRVGALGGQYSVRGGLSFLPIGFGFNGDVTLRNPDTAKMLAVLGYIPAGPLGALDLKAKLKTNGVEHDISALTGRIGDMPVSGTLSVRSAGAKPKITANLKTGVLDIARFLAKTGKTKKRADVSPSNPLLILAAYPRDAKTSRVDKRWSRKTFDLGVLNALNGELTLKSDALRFGAYSLENADIHAIVKDGVLTADRLAGRMFGGPVSGTAIVRAKGRPSLETNIKVDALNIGQAVKAIVRKDLANGRLSLDLSLNADGTSPAALVSSLSGKGALNIKALDVKKGGKGTALAPLIGLLGALNQFALPMNGKKKSGLADLATNFDVLNGVADVRNLKLTSALGSGTGSGRVDIARWTIDFAGKMLVEPNILSALLSKGRVGREEVPFSVSGRLDNPGVKLGLRPAGSASPAGSVSPASRLTSGKPANAFQEILKNVLPGIAPAPKQQTAPSPSGKSGGELAPPPPQQTPQPAQKRKLSPQERIIQQLMKGL